MRNIMFGALALIALMMGGCPAPADYDWDRLRQACPGVGDDYIDMALTGIEIERDAGWSGGQQLDAFVWGCTSAVEGDLDLAYWCLSCGTALVDEVYGD